MARCKECRDTFKQRFLGQKFCRTNDLCLDAETKFAFAEKERVFLAKCRKDRTEFKKKDKTYVQRVNETKKVFQAWIRLVRDKDIFNCISCDYQSKTWDGGHYLKAETFSGLIFDERNVHKQCVQCNHRKGGNELNYRDGLIKRYGIEYVEGLESIKNDNRVKTWSDAELEAIKIKYKI